MGRFAIAEHEPIRVQKLNALDARANVSACSVTSKAAIAKLENFDALALLFTASDHGIFAAHSYADHAAAVDADTAQGIYIRSTVDPTRVWIRQIGERVNMTWFGIVSGKVPANGIANSTFFAVMKAVLAARAYNTTGTHRSLDPIWAPPEWYEFDDHDGDGIAIDLKEGTFDILGAGMARIDTTPPTAATVFKFPSGVTGIVTQMHNTDGKTGRTGTGFTAKGTKIAHITLQGGFPDSIAEGNHHGILARTVTNLEHVVACDFEGEGAAYIGDSMAFGAQPGIYGGNVDGSNIDHCMFDRNRTGLYLEGADANVCQVEMCSFRSNRQWGLWDSSLLGNTYPADHWTDNGTSPFNDGVRFGATCVHMVATDGTVKDDGVTPEDFRYQVRLGEAVWAAANSPSGSKTHNQGWYYIGTGPSYSGMPTWTAGMLVREGGPIYSDLINAKNQFDNPYIEGNQGFPILTGGDLVVNGQLTDIIGGCRVYTAGNSELTLQGPTCRVTGNLSVNGAGTTLGPSSGAAANNIVTLQATGTLNTVLFRSWSGGSVQTDGQLRVTRGVSMLIDHTNGIDLQVASTTQAQVTSSGVNLPTGKTLSVNGLQVVGARQGAIANPTGGTTIDAEARATIDAILTAMRAHGGIAT